MGWWEQDEEGHSFAIGSGMLWGDGPADIMDDALQRIRDEFAAEVGRPPTTAELIGGLRFALGGDDEEDEVEPIRAVTDVELPDAEETP